MNVPILKKAVAKYNKSTINDLVMGMAAVACKKYMLRRKDDQKTINMIIPFSMRPLPNKKEDLRLINDFSGMSFTMDLHEDIREATLLCQKKTRKLKVSLYPHGIRAVSQFASVLPGIIGQFIIHWLIGKATLLFSNMAGPKNGLTYGGHKAIGMIALVPGMGDNSFGMTGVSLENTLYFTCQGDTFYCEDPWEFMRIVEEVYD